MIEVPESFERSLRNYDPQLRLRWGQSIKQWVIERIGRVSEGEARLLQYAASREDADPKACEEWESARNGRNVIHYAKYLDRRIHDYLWEHDLQKHGFRILNRFLRTQERKRQQKRSESHELARETVSIMGHLSRRKSSAIHQGKADSLVREALHLTPRPEPKKSATFSREKPPSFLVDQFGRDLAPRTNERKVIVI